MIQTRRTCLTILILGGAGFMVKPGVTQNRTTIMDFTDANIARHLSLVNDDVMGGQSNSRFVMNPEGLVFEGVVSLENNGGFASVRCAVNFPEKCSALQLTARGDEKLYRLVMRTEQSTSAPMYQCRFLSSSDWKTHQFQSEDFEASFRGRPVNAKPLVFSEVKEFGILIADKQKGAFRLQLGQLSLS